MNKIGRVVGRGEGPFYYSTVADQAPGSGDFRVGSASVLPRVINNEAFSKIQCVRKCVR